MTKKLKWSLIWLMVFSGWKLNAQVELRTEYIGRSGFRNAEGIKTGGKGDAKVYSFNARVPLSVETDEDKKPVKLWAIGVGASYTKFSNRNMDERFGPDQILNASISVFHLRPISEKWSVLGLLGGGIYSGSSDLSRIGFRNFLGNGGVIFIWHIRKNLDVGLGPVINTLLGYPMIFPGVYLNWNTEGNYEVNVAVLDGLKASVGKDLGARLHLGLVAELNGAAALENRKGKKLIFTHQYFSAGLQPQWKLGKSWSVSAMAGLSAGRTVYDQERTLKSIFSEDDSRHPHFGAAPYFSLSLKYGF